MGPLLDGFTVILIFIALSMPIIVIGLIYYLKKKLDHKEILAAIEKGTPLSEIKPARAKITIPRANWIQDLTNGITLLIIGAGFVPMVIIFTGSDVAQQSQGAFNVFWVLPVVFLGTGIGKTISGVLRRKHEKEI